MAATPIDPNYVMQYTSNFKWPKLGENATSVFLVNEREPVMTMT